MYKVPLFDLNFDEQEENAVIQTLRSRWISTGPQCQQLESMFCSTLRVNHALTTSSCTTALHLALLVLNIQKGDEVIVPSLTFAATVNAVKYVGASPVFADIISFSDISINPADIERKITEKTKAIIPVHYGGFPCPMDNIMALAKKHSLKVIEDASHAPLSEYKGKKLGTIGDIGTFSFFSNKNISTGEGGLLVTDHEECYQAAKLLRSHGMTTVSYERSKGHATKYDIACLGYNYRMDDIRASLGIVQLGKLLPDLQKRNEVRKWYTERLGKVDELILPYMENSEFVSNYIMPVVLKNSTADYREEVRNRLHEKGIQTSVHYPAIHRFSVYKEPGTKLPVTEYIADNEITLPMYSSLKESDVEFICQSVVDCIT